QAASTRAVIPSLESAAQQDRFAIATLLGLAPEALLGELSPDVAPDLPAVPPQVPVGLPSDLLQRRPDIRRSEAQLHAAPARIGVATADLYPKFSLTGTFGLEGGKISALSTIADRFWSVGPAMQWNLFSGGRIQSNIQVQEALAAQSFDTYRKT